MYSSVSTPIRFEIGLVGDKSFLRFLLLGTVVSPLKRTVFGLAGLDVSERGISRGVRFWVCESFTFLVADIIRLWIVRSCLIPVATVAEADVVAVSFGKLIVFDSVFGAILVVAILCFLSTTAAVDFRFRLVFFVNEDVFIVAFLASEESRYNSSNAARFSTLSLLSIFTKLVGSVNTPTLVDDRGTDSGDRGWLSGRLCWKATVATMEAESVTADTIFHVLRQDVGKARFLPKPVLCLFIS